MRLLDTLTLKLSEFVGEMPPYAILSHIWADEEVLFQDLDRDPWKKSGWAKVTASCSLAYMQGYSWIWIDTCCIDKSSSAELSEAINSMFAWYSKADICFAYLADVPYWHPESEQCAFYLVESRWFTRGWTLQELLAPRRFDFYSSDWTRISSRSDLRDDVGNITGIDPVYLDGKSPLVASVAERMCWALKRNTTRVEDIAYCLLGLFDVNMPLIYGEGIKAFRRLQEVILRNIDDHSLFAWGTPHRVSVPYCTESDKTPLLAEHPSMFNTFLSPNFSWHLLLVKWVVYH